MKISDFFKYDKVSGQNLARICALSDGIFAIALTLIVFEIRIPAIHNIHTESDLWRALVTISPKLITFLLSFLTLGIFWTGQQTQLHFLSRANRDLTWIHFSFLAGISVLPFSTTLLANLADLRLPLIIYWGNILYLGTTLYASWRLAYRAKLIKDDAPPDIFKSVEHRLILSQILYAAGAALCIFNTKWSITFIILVQVISAIAPKSRWLRPKNTSTQVSLPKTTSH